MRALRRACNAPKKQLYFNRAGKLFILRSVICGSAPPFRAATVPPLSFPPRALRRFPPSLPHAGGGPPRPPYPAAMMILIRGEKGLVSSATAAAVAAAATAAPAELFPPHKPLPRSTLPAAQTMLELLFSSN